jgi:hypothetical protein
MGDDHTAQGKTLIGCRREEIKSRVTSELLRQDAKWGFPQQVCGRPVTPMEWGGILAEEVGELCKELNDIQLEVPTARLSKARDEAVQVAAVAINIIVHMEVEVLRHSG